MYKFVKLLLLGLVLLNTQIVAKEKSLETVTLQLQWKHQFEFAGFYAAKEKGFYKDVGLDVHFKEFEKDTSITQTVLTGKAQYGLTYSSLVSEYLNGKPLVLVANFFKQSPLVLIAQPNIKSPKELKNKKIMGLSDSIHNITLLTMLKQFDIKKDDFINIPTNFKLDYFINKKIDAMSIFTTNELYELNQKGVAYTIFDPVAYGAKYYDANLFTSQKELKEHPQRVKKFKEASIKGWQYALTHQEEIIDLIIEKYNTQDKTKEALRFEAKQIEYIMLPKVHPIGSIDKERVRIIAENFIQAGFIPSGNLNIDHFIYEDTANPLNLTDKELAFIKDHPKIVLGSDKSWKPYVVTNNDGSVSGYDADILQLINKVSGANFILSTGKWSNMQRKARTKEIDGLSTGAIHKERKEYLNFSDIYISMQKMIITSKENPKNIHSLKDLDGKTIAIHKSNLVDEKTAQKFPRSTILRFDSIEEVISAVITGKADALFGNGAIFYLANELGMPYLKRSANLGNNLELSFGVRKDWPEAISIINKSLASIGSHTRLGMKRKWFGSEKSAMLKDKSEALQLSKEEKKYLLDKKTLRMCVDPNWMPYEKIKYGEHIGISAEYIRQLSSKINTPISLVQTETWGESLALFKENKCDMLSLIVPTKSRKKIMNFTAPYLNSSYVIATNYDTSYISDLAALQEKEIGLVRNHASSELLEKKYLNIRFVKFNTLEEGLELVVEGKLYGFIDSLTTLSYQIQQRFPKQLKISGQLQEKLPMSIAVHKDASQLLDIFNKAITLVPNHTKEDILNHWISVKFEHENSRSEAFWKIISPILILALLLIISHFVQYQYNKKLKEQVRQHVEALREKDEILLQKHRMAAMGEMLSLIAHQWRQPLGAINTAVMGINIKIQSGKFDLNDPMEQQKFLKYLKRKHTSISDYVQYLSSTTDDFRNFFNPNKSKEVLPIIFPIENALKIVEYSINKNGIYIAKDLKEESELSMYPNEIMQVILNILKNSEYNFIEKEINHPRISISTSSDQKKFMIRICDNGGGIPEEIVKKIFEPYYTTKDEKHGSGLGLYMSKIIMEEHHHGLLTVKNKGDGVCFEMIFKT